MKQMIVTAALALALAASTSAAEAEKDQRERASRKNARELSTTPVTAESPLVRAARKAQEAREKAGKAQVEIDDQSVRRSEGKLTINHTPAPEILTKAAPAGETLDRMEADKRRALERAAAQEQRLADLRKEIQGLEAQLSGTEDDYYDEEDEAYRESVLYPRFEAARKALAEKRKELAELESSGLRPAPVLGPAPAASMPQPKP